MKKRGTAKKSLLSDSALLPALAVNLFLFAFIMILFYPTFGTNDDTGLESLVAGSRSMRDPHMIYSNYLLGQIFVFLFRLFPGVQWTAMIQYALLFISFTSVTGLFFQKFPKVSSRILVVAFVAFFAFETYVHIQYTKTSGVAAASGLMMVMWNLKEEGSSKSSVIAGIVLTVFGALFRAPQAYCEMAIFISLILYLLIYFLSRSEVPWSRIWRSAATGLVIVLLLLVLRSYDGARYQDNEWGDFREYDHYRVKVVDYGIPKYGEYKDRYNDLGIDKTAFYLMKRWTFIDNEKFTTDVFKRISEFPDKKPVGIPFVTSFFGELFAGLAKEYSFLVFLALFVGWAMIGKRDKMSLLALLCMIFIVICLYFYMYYSGRFMIHRVDVGIWYAASLIALFTYDENSRGWLYLIPALLILAVFLNFSQWSKDTRAACKDEVLKSRTEREVIEKIGSDKDHLYLARIGNLKMDKAYGVFDPMPYRGCDNVYPLGGWTAGTPAYRSVLKRYDIRNPFRDMIDNEKVYIVDKDPDATLAYIRKWYCPTATARKVKEMGDKIIYRITSSHR